VKKTYSFLLVVLAGVFCVALVVSNIIAGKMWQAPFGIVLTCGVFLFPVVYIIGDVVPEVYGLMTARRMIWLGFAVNLLAVVIFLLTLQVAFPSFWQNQNAFQTVLGFTPRLLVASFVGYLIGTHVNAWIMVRMKTLTSGRWLWTRTISSTIAGEAVDSLLFMILAFWGIVPWSVLPSMILAQICFKTFYEILATPLTYLVVGWVKRKEGVL
jgi:uncharacterized integral membrane protein (TIGR00697 family)